MLCSFNGTVLPRVLPPLLLSQFVLGALGNGLALWIFYFHLKPWKSSVVLLFNLAVSDFLLIMVLPFRASYYLSGLRWTFGKAFCNICLFMLAMNRSGSALFLMAIALDRYMRVVHPHHPINFVSPVKAMCGASVLWLLAISMSAQVLALQHINTTLCESFAVNSQNLALNVTGHKLAFLIVFYVPLAVIVYCSVSISSHLRGRKIAQHAKIKRALIFIVLVVILFITCFLPSNIVQLVIWHKTNRAIQTLAPSEVCLALEDLTTLFYITISLTYLNSVLDPVVYYFSNPAIKSIFRRMMHLPQASETAESMEKKSREMGSLSHNQI